MLRYYRLLKAKIEDLNANLDSYLERLKGLAERYKGRVYIFGSTLRGRAIAASDVDVLIEVPDSVDRLEVLHEARRLVPNTKVEIHVLNISDAKEFKKLVKTLKPI